MEEKIPSDVSLRNMTVTNGQVSVSGTCSGKPSMALLQQQLESIDNIVSVQGGAITETKDSNGNVTLSFTLTCSFSLVKSVENGETETATEAAK